MHNIEHTNTFMGYNISEQTTNEQKKKEWKKERINSQHKMKRIKWKSSIYFTR